MVIIRSTDNYDCFSCGNNASSTKENATTPLSGNKSDFSTKKEFINFILQDQGALAVVSIAETTHDLDFTVSVLRTIHLMHPLSTAEYIKNLTPSLKSRILTQALLDDALEVADLFSEKLDPSVLYYFCQKGDTQVVEYLFKRKLVSWASQEVRLEALRQAFYSQEQRMIKEITYRLSKSDFLTPSVTEIAFKTLKGVDAKENFTLILRIVTALKNENLPTRLSAITQEMPKELNPVLWEELMIGS